MNVVAESTHSVIYYPLTTINISSRFDSENLEEMLIYLVSTILQESLLKDKNTDTIDRHDNKSFGLLINHF